MRVTGMPSGDCECFCFDVTEEEYRRVCGDEAWKLELETTIASEDEMREEMGLPPIPPSRRRWRLYPGDILRALGVDEEGKDVTLEINVV